MDEIKFIENITVDQRHDLTTRRLGGCCEEESIDGVVDNDDDAEVVINFSSNDVAGRSIGKFSLSNS